MRERNEVSIDGDAILVDEVESACNKSKQAVLQQQALGIVGVNLIYGALYYRSDPRELIE